MDGNRKIEIMGIVNVNDDSFYGESRCADVQSALSRAAQMIGEGADIIDFGACSTRPGAVPIGPEEEWRRLEPVLKAFREIYPDHPFSLDTYWSSVAQKAYMQAGPFIVNDISAGCADPRMLDVAGSLGLTYVAMHLPGTAEDPHRPTIYSDVTRDVIRYFEDFSLRAERAGVREWILDPGFGFSKTISENYALLDNLSELAKVRRKDGKQPPLLVGLSRKSMIYKPLGISPEDSLPAVQALHLVALQKGAGILRVHDVAEARRTVTLYQLLSGECRKVDA